MDSDEGIIINGTELNPDYTNAQVLIRLIAAEEVAVRREQNMLLPVSCLPAEVMQDIFSYLPYEAKRGALSLDAMNVSHVCSRWREMALGYAPLWSVLCFFKNRDYVETFINRSGNAPLTLRYNKILEKYDLSWSNFRLALRHLERTRELEISGKIDLRDRFSLTLKDDINRPAPILEVFCFNADEGCHGTNLPLQLFGGHAPLLHYFYSCGTNVPWNNAHFMVNLTEFHVHDQIGIGQPTLHQLLFALQQCQHWRCLL